MSINVKIEGFRGCLGIDFDILKQGAVMLHGPNACGKSSAAQGIGAVLSRDPNPLGFSATQYKHYENQQFEGDTAVSLHDGDDALYWFPSSGFREPSGQWLLPSQPPVMSSLFDFTTRKLPTQELSEMWDSLFMPPPSEVREKIAEELKELVSKKRIKELTQLIEESGWKYVEEIYKGHRLEAQRDWSKITGVPWGKKKAQEWRPDGWKAGLEGITVEKADQRVAYARAQYQADCSADAVSAEMHEQAQEARRMVDQLVQEKVKHEEKRPPLPDTDKRDDLMKTCNDITSKLFAHSAAEPKMPQLYACPHCTKALVMEGGVPVNGEDQERIFTESLAEWEKQKKKMEWQKSDADKEYEDFMKGYKEVAKAYQTWKDESVRLNTEIQAHQKFAAKADAKVLSEADTYAVERSRQAELDARDDKKRVEDLEEAERCKQNAYEYGHMASLVGPKGLRYKMVSEGIARLNEVLESITEFTKWKLVCFDSKSRVNYGGYPLGLCSESERWVGQACIQTAIGLERIERAKQDGKDVPEECIVLDGADKLDTMNSRRFAQMVAYANKKGLSYIITATENSTCLNNCMVGELDKDKVMFINLETGEKLL